MDEFISVTDRLPTENGWYLVYAPEYIAGSSSSKEKANDVMFSKYYAKSGWSVETPRNKGCVRFWMPVPQPEKLAKKFTVIEKGKGLLPLMIRFETYDDFLSSTQKYDVSLKEVIGDYGIKFNQIPNHEALPIATTYQRIRVPIYSLEKVSFPRNFELNMTIENELYYVPILSVEEGKEWRLI